jgi:hypothetical protein
MKCHKCNQNSIDIKDGHIVCDICGLDIDVSYSLEEDNLFDLFFYNKNLDSAKALGIESHQNGDSIESNPYNSSNQLSLHNNWLEGWSCEEVEYEKEGLSLSAENYKSELEVAIQEVEELIGKSQDLHSRIRILEQSLISLSKNKYFLGRTYRQELSTILQNCNLDIPDN